MPRKVDSDNKKQFTVRFPLAVIEDVEEVMKGRYNTPTEFIREAVRNRVEELRKNKKS